MLKWMATLSTVLITTSLGVAQDNDVKLPDGPGKAIVERMCVDCHKLKVVTSKHATKEQWTMTVQQMVSRGADGTDEEIETVIEYLAKNFPPQKNDKPASATSSATSIEQRIGPNELPFASLLTMSKVDESAMLRSWKRSTDTSPSVRAH